MAPPSRLEQAATEIALARLATADWMPFAVGEVLSGTFEIVAILGSGGMGVVFEAHDLLLNRRVAIKVSRTPDMAGLLRSEAQAMAAIRHPAMVIVHGCSHHQGHDYVVMERVYGKSLGDHLFSRRAAGQFFSLGEVTDILRAVGEGLQAVHLAGISHRDIKPANIMLTPGGRVVLLDFGLVRPEFAPAHAEGVAGSPGYMAPEVLADQIQPGAGHLADLYALGVVAFELLTNRLPLEGDTLHAMLANHREQALPDLSALRPDVPLLLATMIGKLLNREPLERPALEEVLWSLRTFGSGVTITDKQFTVLIVDDDEDLTALLTHSIQAAMPGTVVSCVHSAEKAIESVTRSVPDAMLLDLQLPGMNGIELLMYLRGTHLADRMRIIAMSARASGGDAALLLQLGVVRFIPKDIQAVDLVNAELAEIHRQQTS